MTITKKELETFLQLHQKIEEECYRLCKEMYELDPECIDKYLIDHGTIENFGSDSFHISATESYRGNIYYYGKNIPPAWLIGDEWKAEVLAQKVERDNQKRKKEQEQAAKTLEHEKRLYESLAKKFAAPIEKE